MPDMERLGYLDLAVVTPDGTAHYIGSEETTNLGDRDYIKKKPFKEKQIFQMYL